MDARDRSEPDEPMKDTLNERSRTGIDVTDVRTWLVRNGWIVVVCAILGAVVASLYTARIETSTYRASALLAIVPPGFSSELLPSTLTVQGYQELLESDAVFAQTEARLVESGVLAEGARLPRGRLRSRIFVSQRREETLLAPMILLEARSPSSEVAAAVANTWAEVFLQRVDELMFGAIASTVEFIEEQYPQARDRLEELENEQDRIAGSLETRRAQALVKWDRSLADARSERARLVGAYSAETARLTSEYQAEHQLEVRRTELDSLRAVLREHQREHAEVGARLASAELETQELDDRLSQIDPIIVLSRSVDENALIAGVIEVGGASEAVKALEGLTLRYETQNPVYNQLSVEAARRRADLAVLRPRAEQLAEQIGLERKEIARLGKELARDEAGLERLRTAREAGLEVLYEERSTIETSLEIQRDAELSAIDRERELRLEQSRRQVEQERALFEDLADKYNEAVLAKGQEEIQAIRLAAPAVAPREPLPSGGGSKSLLGLLLGAIVGVLVSAGRNLAKRVEA